MDLATILASMRISRRPGTFTMVTLSEPVEVGPGIDAVINESEGQTVVVSVAEAERRGWPAGFRAAWLTVDVHSSLAAVGLTAAASPWTGACMQRGGEGRGITVVPANKGCGAAQLFVLGY